MKEMIENKRNNWLKKILINKWLVSGCHSIANYRRGKAYKLTRAAAPDYPVAFVRKNQEFIKFIMSIPMSLKKITEQ